MSPRRTHAVVASAAVLLIAGGCASPRDLRHARAERDAFAAQARRNQVNAHKARAEAHVYRAQLEAADRDARAKDAAIADLTGEMIDLQSDLDRANAAYDAAERDAKNPLPADLASNLRSFAAANADLLAFDAEAGVMRLQSDVTFAPGSAELTKEAVEALKKLAGILNARPARELDLMVAGHTDAKPVSRTRTIKDGHKDNWYLSSHRAIAVGEELRVAGVAGERVAVVGYADQRPAATNVTADGRAMNRRVELVLLPALPGGGSSFATEKPEAAGGAFDWLFSDGTEKPAKSLKTVAPAEPARPTASMPRDLVFEK